ncbi:small, acid-soluble spore protein, H family [Sutcliffiella horikoshii]
MLLPLKGRCITVDAQRAHEIASSPTMANVLYNGEGTLIILISK